MKIAWILVHLSGPFFLNCYLKRSRHLGAWNVIKRIHSIAGGHGIIFGREPHAHTSVLTQVHGQCALDPALRKKCMLPITPSLETTTANQPV